jgi:hypothetical protein
MSLVGGQIVDDDDIARPQRLTTQWTWLLERITAA